MHGRSRWIAVVGVVVLAGACGEAAPPAPGEDPASFGAALDGVAIEAGDPPAIATLTSTGHVMEPSEENRYTNPGWVQEHDGVLYSFRNSFDAWPGRSETHLLTSTDGGTSWEVVIDEPVWTSSSVPWIDEENHASFLMDGYVAEDGTWVAFFDTFAGTLNASWIGRATAPGPEGPWTADPDPVLEPTGVDGEWDGRRLAEPEVIHLGGGRLRMWFTAHADTRTSTIGTATSEDGGRTWAKDDGPVLVGAQEWDGGHVRGPEVEVTSDGGFAMIYRTGVQRSYGYGLAWSANGVDWSVSSLNPVMDRDRAPDGAPFFQSATFGDGDRPIWLLEVGDVDGTVVHRYEVDVLIARAIEAAAG